MDLQELSDRAEINDVLIRYTRAIDTGDWDRLDTVFTPDAQIDYTESGGIAAAFPEVKPWLAEMLPAFFPKRMHTLGQVEIRLDGDSAEVSAYFHNPMPMDDGDTGGDQARRVRRHLPPHDDADAGRLAQPTAPRRSRLEAEHLMPAFTRAELEAALAHYTTVVQRCSATGDWSLSRTCSPRTSTTSSTRTARWTAARRCGSGSRR